MRLPRTVYSRVAALALLSVVTLLISACDALVPPITIQNSTSDDITVSFLYRDSSPLLLIREQGGNFSREPLIITPGESPQILISGVELPQYTLVVKNSGDQEIFRRTFLKEELDERDWKITITPEGIQ